MTPAADPAPLQKISLAGLNKIQNVSIFSVVDNRKRKTKLDGSYIVVNGTRKDPESGKVKKVTVTIKFTDADSLYLNELEVSIK